MAMAMAIAGGSGGLLLLLLLLLLLSFLGRCMFSFSHTQIKWIWFIVCLMGLDAVLCCAVIVTI